MIRESFVIYNKTSFRRMRNRHGQETFANKKAASATLRSAIKREVAKEADWVVDTYEAWVAADPIVETHNMLDPDKKPLKIRKSEKGTFMDPATERFHTM